MCFDLIFRSARSMRVVLARIVSVTQPRFFQNLSLYSGKCPSETVYSFGEPEEARDGASREVSLLFSVATLRLSADRRAQPGPVSAVQLSFALFSPVTIS